MTQEAKDIKLGRFLSLVLRHNPSAAGITLDAGAYRSGEQQAALLILSMTWLFTCFGSFTLYLFHTSYSC